MTADSIKPQADVNSPTTPSSAQPSKVNHWEVQSSDTVKCINLLLGTEALDSKKIKHNVVRLYNAINNDRDEGIPFGQLLKSQIFEALVRAVILSGMHTPPVFIPELGEAILRFPLDVLKSYYSKPNISPERRAWLYDTFEEAIVNLHKFRGSAPVTALLCNVQNVLDIQSNSKQSVKGGELLSIIKKSE
ncbi:hypothetical protein GQ42DRAFT_165666 [Ramicandelaber brevisporus]|nr:hypothetical protein GQ42DRAFT_165666 [Ramicandelaber brevisporus]